MSAALAQEPQPPPAPTPSVVYAFHDANAIANDKTNPKIVKAMVNRLVTSVTGQSDVAKAWASLVSPTDKVGIKISAAGGELFTTHHDVVNAIADGLVASGYSRANIIVWDRSLGGIKDAGYSRADGYQLRSVLPGSGYNPKATVSAPLLGKLVWGDLEYQPNKGGKLQALSDQDNTSSVSHFSRILSNDVTKIINVPVMGVSETNGIAGCIYNMTIPNIDNWRRFTQPFGFGRESLAEIYSNPMIQNRVVLNLMDGLTAQSAGAPQSQPNWAFHHATLYASKDPVAIDAMAAKKLEQWRIQASLPSIGHSADYIKAAAQIGLGNASPNRFEIRNVGK